ncbi:MAG: asparaginase, partial [Phenylobacterium sp.]
ISMTATAGRGLAPTLQASDLVQGLQDALGERCTVEPISFRTMPGASLGFEDMAALVDLLAARFAAGAAGAVVVHGTDTIEETVFLLDLCLPPTRAVVVTGAMRGAEAAGADGPANLLAALMVASDPLCADLGALVVMNDQLHPARLVRKAHTALPSAFVSDPGGPIGAVIEGRVRLHAKPVRNPARRPLAAPSSDYPVALVKPTLGDDGRLIAALPGLGFRGVVVEAMGAGHTPESWAGPLEALAAKMPVVLASRTAAGRTFRGTYGFAGSERDLLQRGLVPSGDLSAVKARLLLQALLTADASRPDIEAAFDRF